MGCPKGSLGLPRCHIPLRIRAGDLDFGIHGWIQRRRRDGLSHSRPNDLATWLRLPDWDMLQRLPVARSRGAIVFQPPSYLARSEQHLFHTECIRTSLGWRRASFQRCMDHASGPVTFSPAGKSRTARKRHDVDTSSQNKAFGVGVRASSISLIQPP
jgi:hypothetical protein